MDHESMTGLGRIGQTVEREQKGDEGRGKATGSTLCSSRVTSSTVLSCPTLSRSALTYPTLSVPIPTSTPVYTSTETGTHPCTICGGHCKT